MGRVSGNRSSAPRKGGNTLWAGILAGTLIGVGMAAGVAWYLMKSPSPFTKKEQQTAVKPQPEPAAATENPVAPPGDGKPRFQFYQVLTGKQQPGVTPAKPAEKPKPAEKSQLDKSQPGGGKAIAPYEPQILQAGSFSHVDEAEKQKAKLAMLGVEANIQTATIPEKGVVYRVRLGPYKNPDDMNRVSGILKQNGVDSTPMRAQ